MKDLNPGYMGGGWWGFFFLIEIYVIYNGVLVSGVGQL